MTTSGVLFENHDKIGIIKINNPSRANALSQFVVKDLHDQVQKVLKQDHVSVVIFCAGESKAFCAGADLKERQNMNEDEIISYVKFLRNTFDEIASIPVPTIAAISGLALGGGCELALACDMRVMEEDALIGLTETSWGIIPGAGGTQRLTQIVGMSKAKELIFTARKLSAAEADKLGLINMICKSGEAGPKAIELAEEIKKCSPVSVRLAKAAIQSYDADNMKNGLKTEWDCYTHTIPTQDRLEGLAAFREKRSPIFTGK